MYIVTNEITITWVIAPTSSPLAASDYDIKIIPSDLNGTYTDAAIINYAPPDAIYAGNFQYKFTPTSPGLFQVFLTTGTAASYQILNRKDFWIFCASPTVAGSTIAVGASSIIPVACP